MANINKTVKLGVFTLAIMNVTAVVSLRGLPAEAVYGLSSAFYYLFAAIVFLIPTSLVAAELAAMFQDKQGGVFRWVGEAYGKRLGFLAIWVQWIESTIWYPTVLTFGAVSIAFIGMDHPEDMLLANNKYYTLAIVLIIYWLATFISLKGLSWVGKVAKIGGMVGTIIPAALLIILGIVYLATGGHSNMDFHSNFFPDFSKFDNLVLAASIFLFYAGMEMGGIHVKDVDNPSKNYPKAVFIGALITVLIFVLGTFALGVIIPAKDINLTQSLLVGFDNYFKYIHASWLSPIIAVALAFGVLAGVDQQHVRRKSQHLLCVQHIVVVAAHTGQFQKLGEGLGKDGVFPIPGVLPSVNGQSADLIQALGPAHQHEVDQVVGHGDGLGLFFQGDGPAGEVGKGDGAILPGDDLPFSCGLPLGGASLGARGGFPCPTAGEYRPREGGPPRQSAIHFLSCCSFLSMEAIAAWKCPSNKKATKAPFLRE